MNLALRFILLVTHFILVGIMVYYIGDLMSQSLNILLVLGMWIAVVALIVTIIKHCLEFIIHFKNTIKKP